MTKVDFMRLKQLAFTGPKGSEATLAFGEGVTLVYGASNTGKSFACKAIDFLLGAKGPLPENEERLAYDRAALGVLLGEDEETTISRPLAGGSIEVVRGIVSEISNRNDVLKLSAKHDARNEKNLSMYLLARVGLAGKQIATDANATKRQISFRDLSQFCVVDETSIQAERSPVESGIPTSQTAERSVFRLLLTGNDDSALTTFVRAKDFKTSRNAKVELVEELLQAVEEELEADFPDRDDLEPQLQRLEESLTAQRAALDAARTSVRGAVDQKRALAATLQSTRARLSEIDIHLGRFEQLEEVYASDIQRLEALEEASFLLLLGSDHDCPLCGAPPGAQKHTHGLVEVETAKNAALAEIKKIGLQQQDLKSTVADLQAEQGRLSNAYLEADEKLKGVETEIVSRTPDIEEAQKKYDELQTVREHVRYGLSLIARATSLAERRDLLAATKPVAAEDKPKLTVPPTIAHEFAQEVAAVLKAWHFPGQHHVSFDDASFDLKIDGKHRRDNGKGVRAITHAAFKVALLIYCRKRDLPHPGFVVLDTPLLTYRDPIAAGDALSDDEAAIKATPLKDHFFRQLLDAAAFGQVMVFENVDPPVTVLQRVKMHVFSGKKGVGRSGLL